MILYTHSKALSSEKSEILKMAEGLAKIDYEWIFAQKNIYN